VKEVFIFDGSLEEIVAVGVCWVGGGELVGEGLEFEEFPVFGSFGVVSLSFSCKIDDFSISGLSSVSMLWFSRFSRFFTPFCVISSILFVF